MKIGMVSPEFSAGLTTLTRSTQTGLVQTAVVSNATTAYTHSSFGELSRRIDSYANAAFLDTAYTRDNAGRIIEKTETSGATTHTFGYTYDTAGRLAEVTKDGTPTATYTYDANGNRLSFTPPLVGGAGGGGVSATYDAQDRLISYGANAYTYTANGELLSKTDATGTTAYTYDALGNLTKVVLPDGKVSEYIVDGAGRRIAKKVDGILTKGFLYEGSLRIAAELDNTGNVVSRFVYATGVNVPEYMVKGGVTYRIITDHLGSARMVVDVATGAVAQELQYDAFGVVLLDTNPGFTPFGFAGGLYDTDTKLVRFGARDYDAETGRWTAKDPIRFGGGDTNLYGYVLGDPVNGADAWGLMSDSDKAGTGIAMADLGLTIAGAAGKPPTTPAEGAKIAATIIMDHTGALIGFFPDGNAKAAIGVTLGVAGVAMAVTSTGAYAPLSAALAGYGLGLAINGIPVNGSDQTIADWWADHIYDYINCGE